MHGLWVFLIVAVLAGTLSSVAKSLFGRPRSRHAAHELNELRARLAELEGQVGERPLLPPHTQKRVDNLEQRVQNLETIVTGADELLENRLREAARLAVNSED